MNLIKFLHQGAFVLLFSILAIQATGQVCECLNCPQPLPPAGIDTCYERELLLNIKGALNDDLSDPFQGICAVNLHFQHNYVWSQEMYLISPGGDTMLLTGPALTSGYASSALSSWEISFIPSIYPANPDAGFNDTWSNDQLWEVFRKYSGQYYPAEGKLEDFDSGPVNGQWKIILKNCTEIESGQFLNFSITFCDETGLDCSCQAYAGQFLEDGPWYRCLGDPSLELDLQPFYFAPPPDTALYGYSYLLSYNDIYIELSDSIDLRNYPAGVYDVCGLSYELEDQDSLVYPDGLLTVPLLKDSLFSLNSPFCGDVSGNCLKIYIGTPIAPVVIDTTICSGMCFEFGGTNYCQSITLRDTIQAFNGCDSIVDLTLTIQPPVNVYIQDTICQEEFYSVGTNFYNKTGVYTNLLVNPVTGCDSMVILDLFVLEMNAVALAPGILSCLTPILGLNGLSSTSNFLNPDVLWEAGPGGNIVSGSNNLLAFVDAPGSYSLILSKSLVNGKVCADTSFVTVNQNPIKPELTGPQVMDICSGRVLPVHQLPVTDLNSLGGQFNYHSELPFSSANQVTVNISPSQGDSIYIHYIYGACSDTFLLHFNVVPAPFGVLSPFVKICNDPANGAYNTWINFDTLLLQSNVLGSWSNTDGAPVSGIFPLVNFENVPGPISYTFTWTSINAATPCQNISESLEIIVENCACPSVATLPPGPFCENDENIDLQELQITSEQGFWELVQLPIGSNPATILNDSLLVMQRDTGKYVIIFQLSTPPLPGCPDTSSHEFYIQAMPFATLSQRDTVCNDMGSGLWPVDRILGSLILDGDTTGTWEEVTFSGAILLGDTASFLGVDPGVYSFTYTTASAPIPCQESTYSLEMVVMNCICQEVEVIALDTMCNDVGGLDLSLYVLQGGSGSWDVLEFPLGNNPASITASSQLVTSNADSGKYVLRFTLDDPVGGNCVSEDTLELYLVAGVSVTLQQTDTVCNDNSSNAFPVSLDFTDLILGGDTTGHWVEVGNSGASGSFPILNFQGVNPGNYNFLYLTTSAQDPCQNRNYPVSIVVRDCVCPTFKDTLLCNDQVDFLLDELHTSMELITWNIIDVPPGNLPASIVGNSLLINGRDEGVYRLEANWINPPGRECPDRSEVLVELIDFPELQLISPVQVCNQSGPYGPHVLLFDSLILEGTGQGQWIPLDNSNASGVLPLLDFTGVAVGTYHFQYTQNSLGPCGSRQDTIQVEVTDCQCPPYQLIPFPTLCVTEETLELSSYAVGLPPGQWTIASFPPGSNPASLSGTFFDFTDSDAGAYRLVYTFDSPLAGCPDSISQVLTIEDPFSAGHLSNPISICALLDTTLELSLALSDADPGGIWQSSPSNPGVLAGLNSQTGQWMTPDLAISGSYEIWYIQLPTSVCPGDTAILQIDVLPALQANAGMDEIVNCDDWPVLIGNQNAPQGSPWIYDWFVDQQLLGKEPVLEVDGPGTYVLYVTHEGSLCQTRDSVQIIQGTSGPTDLEVVVNQPGCIVPNGQINVIQVVGGTPPFLYQLDNLPWQPDGLFTGLATGSYLLHVEDGAGCRLDSILMLIPNGAFNVDLGPDQFVSKGSVVNLEGILIGNAGQIVEVIWDPLGIVCPDCLTQSFQVDQDIMIRIGVSNADNCAALDEVWIFVVTDTVRFYFPNAISINEDGVNDKFTIYGNEQIELVKTLQVFDRWGNKVYEQFDFPPNNDAHGWDGSNRGQTLNPGVYVFSAILQLKNGETRHVKGDITLLR